MAKKPRISLGDAFEVLISKKIESGRHGSAGEAVRARPRLLQEPGQTGALRRALIDGENGGDAGELDMSEIKGAAANGIRVLIWRIRKHGSPK